MMAAIPRTRQERLIMTGVMTSWIQIKGEMTESDWTVCVVERLE